MSQSALLPPLSPQQVFAVRNVADKLNKIFQNRDMLAFYWETYVLGRLEAAQPDTYIVSYPKCGRTWLRVMLQKYIELIGQIPQHFHNKLLLGVGNNTIIKFEHDQGTWIPAPPTMEQLAFNTAKYAGKKIVFLARDPRDALVSSWYHLKYREQIYTGDLSSFVYDELTGIHKIIAFMNMWVDNKHIPSDFLLITYEQMHREPVETAQQLLQFMNIAIEPDMLSLAVAESSFEKMKRMELEGALREPWMKPGSKDLKNSLKIRKGKVGGFRNELSEQDIAFVNQVIRDKLSPELPYHQ